MTEFAPSERPRRALPWYAQLLIALALLGALGWWGPRLLADKSGGDEPAAKASVKTEGSARLFTPTKAQWTMLTLVTVEERPFRLVDTTEGKIAVDEDNNTPIFPSYSGRVLRLFAKPGDKVSAGEILFTIEATDMVQAQNDFLAGIAAVNKARAQVNLKETNAARQRDLVRQRAVPLKDLQAAEADLVAAQNDLLTAEAALEAVRNRLRILGKSNQEIAAFEGRGRISPETPVYAPLAGTIVQRKVGPGQYVAVGASDPVFVIGDLSTVWLVANVRESDIPKMKVGQPVEVRVLAFPDRVFRAEVSYVAASVDPSTRRLQVRADLPNPDGVLKPEMFATFSIVTGPDKASPAVPRESVIYAGSGAHVWVARDGGSIELRSVTLGLTSGDFVQVVSGLAAGEKVVARGSLFIDHEALGDEAA